MKPLLISLFFFCCLATATGQNETKLFAQGLFQIEDQEALSQIEEVIRTNQNVFVVRLDIHSQRFFIITQGITQLSEQTLKSWFGEYTETVHCIQIGVYGQDPMNAYPFNCEN